VIDGPSAEKPSKSARKREIAALQTLADRMTALSDGELARLGVEETLRQAIAQARDMRPSGARNRQLKYCVRYMEWQALEQVRAYLEDQHSQRVAANRRIHRIEHWRDHLVDNGDHGLEELFGLHGHLDRQRVRQLCRDAVREKETGKPAGAGRRLYRFLRDQLPDAD